MSAPRIPGFLACTVPQLDLGPLTVLFCPFEWHAMLCDRAVPTDVL